jgi:3-oxoacyl-[acyl-carrier protein] reductase|tara:strand:+ start:196 stop:975 length:780 start_codon:yes stop_codon:yes gene_type:complete
VKLGIRNKYALVTGGASGIGRAIALALAEEGCNVALCDIRKKELITTTTEIENVGVQCMPVQADVTVIDDIQKVVDQVLNRWGTLHILINNVGGGGGRVSYPTEEAPHEIWQKVFNLNAGAATYFTMRVIPAMKQNGWGRIVTIASIQGKEGGGRPWYTMAKSAEISLMKTLAMDSALARSGITFNSVAPGGVLFSGNEWDKFRKKDPEKYSTKLEQLPQARLGKPAEIAAAVAFICSEKASYINGACLVIDGAQGKSF